MALYQMRLVRHPWVAQPHHGKMQDMPKLDVNQKLENTWLPGYVAGNSQYGAKLAQT